MTLSQSPASADDLHNHRSKWAVAGIVLAAIGLALSAYSVYHHLAVKALGKTDFACNISSTLSCDAVASSAYSELAGIPLGVFGFAYFAAAIVLLGIGLAGGKSAKEHLQAYVLLTLVGIITSIGLGALSAVTIGAACVTCIGVYVLTLLQLIHVYAGRRLVPRPWEWTGALSGGTSAAIVVAIVIALFNFTKPDTPKVTAGKTPSASQLASTVVEIPVSKSAYAGLGEDYRKGSDSARVVVQEFADYQCPACGNMNATIRQLAAEYGDKILFVFRNYPLDSACNASIQNKMHEWACKAAVTARCAGQYGKFWEMHELLFENQQKFSEPTIKNLAKGIGITDEQLATCWASPDILAKIKDDIDLGNRLGVDSTPTLYINGRKVTSGRSLEDLRAQIDQQLQP